MWQILGRDYTGVRLVRFLLTLLLLVPSLVVAQPALKRENPDELATLVFVAEECRVSAERAIETVHGVLIRSRIKPLDYGTSPGYFALSVIVNCLGKTAFAVQVDFLDQIAGSRVRYGTGHGTFGTYGDDPEYVVSAIKTSTERAVTAYLEANFDLTPE